MSEIEPLVLWDWSRGNEISRSEIHETEEAKFLRYDFANGQTFALLLMKDPLTWM